MDLWVGLVGHRNSSKPSRRSELLLCWVLGGCPAGGWGGFWVGWVSWLFTVTAPGSSSQSLRGSGFSSVRLPWQFHAGGCHTGDVPAGECCSRAGGCPGMAEAGLLSSGLLLIGDVVSSVQASRVSTAGGGGSDRSAW